MEINRVTLAILLITLVTLLSACSTFNRDWRKLEPSRPAGEIDGRWEGEWHSDTRGHTGRLQAIIARKDTDQLWARFHATFWKVFRYSYALPLRVEKHDGTYDLSGEASLGWWAGGLYHYQGTASATNFFSTYRSKSDQGTFHMHRP
jgi:hypothetical protein